MTPDRNLRIVARAASATLLVLASTVAVAQVPSVRVGTFPQQVASSFTLEDGLPALDVRRLVITGSSALLAETTAGWAVFDGGRWRTAAAPPEPTAADLPGVARVALSPSGEVAAATTGGLFQRDRAGGEWRRVYPRDGRHSWASVEVGDVAFDGDGGLWFVSAQGLGHRDAGSGRWSLYAVADGLPYDRLTAVAPGPAGEVWVGSMIGAMRFDGRDWEYRQGRRWLPHDEVRDIVVAADGTVWLATSGGVGRIERRAMTLRTKADYFEAEIDRYHRRTPYGFVDSVRLERPGDRSRFAQRDSDNDGLWTSMYGASQIFAYAATESDAARGRARSAFEALRFLGEVTQGGSPPALAGFVARTILPADGPDPNRGRLEQDRRRRAERDAAWKLIEPRWPLSADRRWYWKCDTSSDELDGHFFFYALYYDLVAAEESERREVRSVVRGIVDHLIEHDFSLVDHDGRPTRWAVFGPQQLNHEPQWWEERGLNSLSVLSYLRVAEHMTGDERYGAVARELIDEHAYAANVRVPKIQSGAGTGNQSDDEMAFMGFYNLLNYERDDELRQLWLHSFFRYWQLEAPERNPLFNFLYARFGLGQVYEDVFGRVELDPTGDWLEDSVDTLKRYPLDRVNWGLRNSHRLDLVELAGSPGRGARRDGKVLPIDERFVDKWNHDPWRFDYGGDGRTLADGASFLLPYYLGLYLGFLEEER